MASKKAVVSGLYLIQSVMEFPISQGKPEYGIPGTVEAWEIALSDMDDREVGTAFAHFIRTVDSEWHRKPRPGDIRKFITSVTEDGEAVAWAEVLGIAQNYNYGAVEWSCPIIRECVGRIGGVMAIAEADKIGRQMLRKQFTESYNGIKDDISRRETARLNGLELPEGKYSNVVQIGSARSFKRDTDAPAVHPDLQARIEAKQKLLQERFQSGENPERVISQMLGIKGLDFGDEADHG